MNESKHILVIRFSAMGDVALTIPALLSVVEAHPQVTITFISRPFYASFIPSHPRINSVGIEVDKYKGILGLKKLANELDKEHSFDEVIDLHNVLRTRLITSFLKLKGKKITTFNKLRKEKKAILSQNSTQQLPHITKQYLNAFAQAGYKSKLISGPWIDTEEKSPLTEFLAKNKLNSAQNKWIGIAPFAAHTAKMWGIENIKNLIVELTKKEVTIFLFGGGKSEVEQLNALENKANKVFSVAGKMPFDQELALMKKLDYLISMDSSNMHFATLIGTPVISIWGATTPLMGFYPLNNQKLIMEVPESEFNKRTLSKYGNKPAKNGYDWRERISLEEVFGRI